MSTVPKHYLTAEEYLHRERKASFGRSTFVVKPSRWQVPQLTTT